jgi:hypothetical protein
VSVGVEVGVLVGVAVGVLVGVGVGVSVGVGVGVSVGVGVGETLPTHTSSIYHPALAVPLSHASRKRRMTVCPAYGERSATTCCIVPKLPPVQADRPAMGLPYPVR